MFRKILYPTDFSDVAGKALGYLKGLRCAGAEEVVVLRVISDKTLECIERGITLAGGRDVSQFLKEVHRSLQEETSTQMHRVEQELKEAGYEVKVRVEQGVPQARILEVAEEEQVSVIVLGSHGRSNLASALLGSVSDHVIRHCRQPVIVIKRD